MSLLFTPINIGGIVARNRFVRSATHEYMGNLDGSISQRQLELYGRMAANEVGLIIAAHSYVEHPRGRAGNRQNGIYDDYFIEGYKRLTEICHTNGAKFVIQVSHAGVQTTPEMTEGVSAADPNLLTEQEILELEEKFALAIKRVKEAGSDGAQVHIAHGYLLSRFVSPQSNRRRDRWGGSLENRLRFPVGIIKRAKSLVGDDFPILVKLNSEGGFAGTAAISLEEAVETAKILEQEGVCAIEVSGGASSEKINSVSRTGITAMAQEAYYAKAAHRIKDAVDIPVILVGGLRTKAVMESMLEDGFSDMVSLSRPFVREPDLVQRLKHGTPRVACISCNKCRNLSGLKCVFSK